MTADLTAREVAWSCPVCDGTTSTPLWRVDSDATENGVDPAAFRPSTDRYGETVGEVVRCRRCGHGSLQTVPSDDVLMAAYEAAEDSVSAVEERGQNQTANRSLKLVERFAARGRLLDVGCWTGSFVAAACERGWTASGVEPSAWAVDIAVDRGLDVRVGTLERLDLPDDSLDCVVMCDVIEHVTDVHGAIAAAARPLRSGGALYLTTPDAGSVTARALGRRWWSILPMHVQYFTRRSMRDLLRVAGLEVAVIKTHPKAFTARYYAERLGGYSPRLAGALVRVLRTLRLADRLVSPNFGDRMQVVAVKR